MLVVENEKYPHIYRHSESNQRLAIYPDHASKKKYAKARYTPRFYVDDYAHAQGNLYWRAMCGEMTEFPRLGPIVNS